MVVSVSSNQHPSHACGIEFTSPKILKVWKPELNRLAVLPYANFRLRERAVWFAGRDQEMKSVTRIRHTVLKFKTL